MTSMPLSFTREVAEVPEAVDDFLAERVERNVLASLLVHARAGRLAGSRAMFAWGTGDRGEVRLYATRTPGWPLLVSELEPSDAETLIERWLEEDPRIPGVTGVPQSARAVAAAWETRTGRSWGTRMREALHVLSQVSYPPQPPAGSLRPARTEDRELLVEWERAFVADAGVIASAAAKAERTVERRLAAGGAYLWQDERPVSMLGLAPQVAGTVRIGPVYTPAEHRRRGYASAAVAAACRTALAGGADQCMLFTDLANATSNKIYAAVGFRRIADWEELGFER
jgi:RimJ/RimL family protein N-acetyltransferase